MKITVEFDSLEEFQEHFTVSSTANAEVLSQIQDNITALSGQMEDQTQKLSDAVDKVYHAGRDDVGGKLHKDIKDIDDVAEDYDEELFKQVKDHFDKLFAAYPNRETIIKGHIKDVVGDYEIRTGLSVNAYEQLQHKARFIEEIMS